MIIAALITILAPFLEDQILSRLSTQPWPSYKLSLLTQTMVKNINPQNDWSHYFL